MSPRALFASLIREQLQISRLRRDEHCRDVSSSIAKPRHTLPSDERSPSGCPSYLNEFGFRGSREETSTWCVEWIERTIGFVHNSLDSTLTRDSLSDRADNNHSYRHHLRIHRSDRSTNHHCTLLERRKRERKRWGERRRGHPWATGVEGSLISNRLFIVFKSKYSSLDNSFWPSLPPQTKILFFTVSADTHPHRLLIMGVNKIHLFSAGSNCSIVST